MGQIIRGTLPGQATGGATSVTELGELSTVGGTDNYLSRVTLVPPVGYPTVTGAATNNFTVNVRQNRAGTATVMAAYTFDAAGKQLVAETPLNIPITASSSTASTWQQGDMADVQLVQNGSGLGLVSGVAIEIEFS